MVEHDSFPTREAIVAELKYFKKQVESSLEKRFIYFIASRTRVRFKSNKQPRYTRLGSKLILNLEIGAKRKNKKIIVSVIDEQTGEPCRPVVQTTPEHITFKHASGKTVTYAVHDFLSHTKNDLEISSEIHYVGYTKNPNSRPINGSHAGLNDVLYSIPTEGRDIFVFYNLFKVLSCANNNKYNMNFVVANSMTDEVDVDTEGQLIEKTLLLYFNAKLQKRNKRKELAELRQTLKQLSQKLRLTSVTVSYALEQPDSYFRFMSSEIDPSYEHLFTCYLDRENVAIEQGSPINEAFGFQEV
ncbi:hypothetical protein V5738_10160 [Salinisphaera sp. SPP-AMP-43]|uniref:hypothetical protein n=1 Tax=Salinisphaera sp. SPP-AMP-43 TaxID=3121288 RepID=UPI003C6DCB6E